MIKVDNVLLQICLSDKIGSYMDTWEYKMLNDQG